MKKFFLTAIAIIVAASAVSAIKPTVYVGELSNPQNYKEAWVEIVRNSVMEALDKSDRITVVDSVPERSRLVEDIARLKDSVAEEDTITKKLLEVRGSHFLLSGVVSTLNVKESVLENGTHSFDADATFILKVVNALDGEMISCYDFKCPRSFIGVLIYPIHIKPLETADAAVEHLKGDIIHEVTKFINLTFPIYGMLQAVKEKKGNEAKSIYINVGKMSMLRRVIDLT